MTNLSEEPKHMGLTHAIIGDHESLSCLGMSCDSDTDRPNLESLTSG